MPHVTEESSSVARAVAVNLLALAVALVSDPVTFIDGLLLISDPPLYELTPAILLVIAELAFVPAAILVTQNATSIFLAIQPVAIVLAAVNVGHDTFAFDHAMLEHAVVSLTINKLQYSTAVDFVKEPETAIGSAICKFHVPFAMLLIFIECSRVFISIRVQLMAFPASHVIQPGAIVATSEILALQLWVVYSTLAMFLARLKLAFVDDTILLKLTLLLVEVV